MNWEQFKTNFKGIVFRETQLSSDKAELFQQLHEMPLPMNGWFLNLYDNTFRYIPSPPKISGGVNMVIRQYGTVMRFEAFRNKGRNRESAIFSELYKAILWVEEV